MNFTIGGKLFVLSRMSAALTLAVGMSGYWGVTKMSDANNAMMAKKAELLEYAGDAQASVFNMRRFEKDIFLNVEDPKKVDEYAGKFAEAQAKFSKELENGDEEQRRKPGARMKPSPGYQLVSSDLLEPR